MTTKQRKEYKLANQRRRAKILSHIQHGEPQSRKFWAQTVGLIQKGK